MNAYVYQAALYCEDCARDICATITAPSDVSDETTYDSDEYPKGPYADGGGEADCPQHCDSCGAFLENPLTSDGRAYVRRAIADALRTERFAKQTGNVKLEASTSVALEEWAPYYGLVDTDDDDDGAERTTIVLSPAELDVAREALAEWHDRMLRDADSAAANGNESERAHFQAVAATAARLLDRIESEST